MAKTKTSMTRLRLLTLLTADLLLLASATTTILLPYIPLPLRYDILGIASGYAIYLQFSTVLSIVGLIGALRESPFPTHIFSTFLLADALISLLPRALLLASLYQPPSTLCEPLDNEGPCPPPSTTACHRLVALSQAAAWAALVAVAAAQVVLAGYVRRYAGRLGEGEWVGQGWVEDGFLEEKEMEGDVEGRGEKGGW